ncbi:class I SAM-dependent methyltransferase [Patescibacteria group bacterium]|nr:class I SAM-dependent methyltransferase [Patescibacteria group bacterium]MBU1256200.1 class I SAM-dependent methyltransferase [Patescibacteria group bacterium]MBU1457726.1 class I SAM-dependent methyltransferase [Patescibacteria group bacterium]
MTKKTYYDRYWSKSGVSGISQSEPPSWSTDNLLWHLDFFREYIGKRVLDFGAGDGTFLYYISRNMSLKGGVALEVSQNAINIGRKKYPKLNFVKGEIESVDIKSKSFDTIIAIEVLEHILDLENVFIEANRILKKGGYFCITTTDFNWFKQVIIAALFWNKYFYPNNPHIRFFTKKTLKSLIGKYGFQLVNYKWNKSYFRMMPKGQLVVYKKTRNFE